MKIVTWNVNGIRSVFGKSFREWLSQEDPDVVCLQKIKADEKALTQSPLSLFKENTGEPMILAGDFNIAHTPYDLENPLQNQDNTMFTLPEREQIEKLVKLGYVDTFRAKYPATKAYSWWSYAHQAREKNIGWRIDYVFVSPPLKDSIQDAFARREVLGSDHGPCGVVLDIPFSITNRPMSSKKPSQGSSL